MQPSPSSKSSSVRSISSDHSTQHMQYSSIVSHGRIYLVNSLNNVSTYLKKWWNIEWTSNICKCKSFAKTWSQYSDIWGIPCLVKVQDVWCQLPRVSNAIPRFPRPQDLCWCLSTGGTSHRSDPSQGVYNFHHLRGNLQRLWYTNETSHNLCKGMHDMLFLLYLSLYLLKALNKWSINPGRACFFAWIVLENSFRWILYWTLREGSASVSSICGKSPTKTGENKPRAKTLNQSGKRSI